MSNYSYKGELMSIEDLVECLNRDDKNPERGSITVGVGLINNKVACRGNRQNGSYEEWHPNGQLFMRCSYVNGYEEGLREYWHPNGQLQSRSECKRGWAEGLYESWWPNGENRIRFTAKNQEFDGTYESWLSDGSLLERTNYKAGKREGLSEKLNKETGIIERKFYKNNRCVAKGDKALTMANASNLRKDKCSKKGVNFLKKRVGGKGRCI